jgi:Platelet-activating factor acetylhydrolase, isoform II
MQTSSTIRRTGIDRRSAGVRAAQRFYCLSRSVTRRHVAPACAGYVSFLFFRSKAWWVPLAKQLLRCALWAVGITQRLPLARVRSRQQPEQAACWQHNSIRGAALQLWPYLQQDLGHQHACWMAAPEGCRAACDCTMHVADLQEATMDDSDATYPVVVFSHGLGGSRSTYSILCSELASQVRN